MDASIRSRGFWIHSSHRFSLEPVLDVAAELASEVADDCAAKLEIAPKGPVSNQAGILSEQAGCTMTSHHVTYIFSSGLL